MYFLQALTELQLIDWINTQVTDWIRGLEDDRKQQLAVAILLILWVSAIASSFIDNIPYTTAMVMFQKILIQFVKLLCHVFIRQQSFTCILNLMTFKNNDEQLSYMILKDIYASFKFRFLSCFKLVNLKTFHFSHLHSPWLLVHVQEVCNLRQTFILKVIRVKDIT